MLKAQKIHEAPALGRSWDGCSWDLGCPALSSHTYAGWLWAQGRCLQGCPWLTYMILCLHTPWASPQLGKDAVVTHVVILVFSWERDFLWLTAIVDWLYLAKNNSCFQLSLLSRCKKKKKKKNQKHHFQCNCKSPCSLFVSPQVRKQIWAICPVPGLQSLLAQSLPLLRAPA